MAYIIAIFILYNNCIFAYLPLPNLSVSPLRSGSVSIMFLVTSRGPRLMPGTWQGLPNDLLSDRINDLEYGENQKGWRCLRPPFLDEQR